MPVGPDQQASGAADRVAADRVADESRHATLRLRRLPDRVAAARAIDVAEAFRDLPGLALLESARPGRNARWTYLMADPVAVTRIDGDGNAMTRKHYFERSEQVRRAVGKRSVKVEDEKWRDHRAATILPC